MGELKELEAMHQVSNSTWTFLTNQTHVLLCVVRDPGTRIRDMASDVGITERAVQRIIAELEEAGYLSRTRHGRTNRYKVKMDMPLRHPIEQGCRISELMRLVHSSAKDQGKVSVSTKSA